MNKKHCFIHHLLPGLFLVARLTTCPSFLTPNNLAKVRNPALVAASQRTEVQSRTWSSEEVEHLDNDQNLSGLLVSLTKESIASVCFLQVSGLPLFMEEKQGCRSESKMNKQWAFITGK